MTDSSFVIWHTAWSRINHRFGARVYGPRDNHREDILMDSVYTDRHERGDNCVHGFGGGNMSGKRRLGRYSLRWENNIKIYGGKTVVLRLRIGTILNVVNMVISDGLK